MVDVCARSALVQHPEFFCCTPEYSVASCRTESGNSDYVDRGSDKFEASVSLNLEHLPQMRFDLVEAARILRLSRAALYQRIKLANCGSRKTLAAAL